MPLPRMRPASGWSGMMRWSGSGSGFVVHRAAHLDHPTSGPGTDAQADPRIGKRAQPRTSSGGSEGALRGSGCTHRSRPRSGPSSLTSSFAIAPGNGNRRRRRCHRRDLEKRVVPDLGHKRIDTLTRADVVVWLEEQHQPPTRLPSGPVRSLLLAASCRDPGLATGRQQSLRRPASPQQPVQGALSQRSGVPPSRPGARPGCGEAPGCSRADPLS